MEYIFQWWLTIFLTGLFFTPFSFILFRNFFDRGYIFSKTIGLLFISYGVFLLGTFKLVPFTPVFIISIAGVLGIFNLFVFRKTFFQVIKIKWSIFFLEEVLFFACIVFWSFIRGHSPDIHGLEKFMDFGFMNSILRTEYFPPKDMWLTPFSINYYFFGHLITAVITKISFVPPGIAYNLMLSTLFAFTFVCSFSIGANLIYFSIRRQGSRFAQVVIAISGLLTGILVSLSGNLQVVYSFFSNVSSENPAPIWDLNFSPLTFPNNYWYPNATRFIHNTIHEFPSYSFVVSDLHGHVLDIPMVLLTLAIFLTVIQSSNKIKIYIPILVSFILAVMYMTNAWDGVIYFLLAVLILLAITIFQSKRKGLDLFEIAKYIFIIATGSVLFSLPFSLYFKPFASGVGVVCAPELLTNLGKLGPLLFEADHCQRSPWWQILTLHGFFYFFVSVFVISFIKKIKIENLYMKIKDVHTPGIFILTLVFLSTLLIIIPEFFYVKDIYPAHYRANTMFKLTYQEFIMLSIVSAYVIMKSLIVLKTTLQKSKLFIFYYLFSFLLLCFVLAYPFFAIGSYYGDLKNFRGLDGTKYIEALYPDDYKALNWINSEIKGQPVILEAQGDSYTDFARISANTGLPTVLGWTVHEWLWRGTYDIPSPRITEIEKIYNGADLNQVKSLINKYKIEYIYIGALEFQKYPNLSEEKINQLGSVIYRNRGVRIYKVN